MRLHPFWRLTAALAFVAAMAYSKRRPLVRFIDTDFGLVMTQNSNQGHRQKQVCVHQVAVIGVGMGVPVYCENLTAP